MEAGMSNLEQSVKSVTDGQQEIREELRECMTELFDLLSTQGKSRQEEWETSYGKRIAAEGENSNSRECRQPYTQRHMKLDL